MARPNEAAAPTGSPSTGDGDARAAVRPATGEPVIRAVEVHKEYGNGVVRALDGCSLEVLEGEWLAIMGASGSGKSTLLQLLAALDVPTSGRIEVRGQDLAVRTHLDHYRRSEIGLVFQLHNLLAHLDALQNLEIAMFDTHRSRAERRQRAEELLAAVGLSAQAGRKPPELSGGERQRVAIARALANAPSIILADEPTGSLDPVSVQAVVDLFDRLHRERGVTIVMVTHDAEVAARADRVVTLSAGRVVPPPVVAAAPAAPAAPATPAAPARSVP